ncbi:MAG: hypothetical protein KA807_17640 [Prolixibacteraceae bacterium]|nr:hypothetical protein [Prolixibacteraceae bacterium]
MTALSNPENKILSVMRIVESNDDSHIRLNANGGNSILLVCEPSHEQRYIDLIKKLMGTDKYALIDLNDLLCEFVSENRKSIEDSFELLQGSISQIFRLPTGEEGPDFFGLILKAIGKSFQSGKIPVLVHSGALYGTGIDNIHIMEHEMIMKAAAPMVILYPAIREKDRLMFLGCRSASKYRCLIIE